MSPGILQAANRAAITVLFRLGDEIDGFPTRRTSNAGFRNTPFGTPLPTLASAGPLMTRRRHVLPRFDSDAHACSVEFLPSRVIAAPPTFDPTGRGKNTNFETGIFESDLLSLAASKRHFERLGVYYPRDGLVKTKQARNRGLIRKIRHYFGRILIIQVLETCDRSSMF